MQWLYDWWERIDSWISENRPQGAAGPAESEAVVSGPEAALLPGPEEGIDPAAGTVTP